MAGDFTVLNTWKTSTESSNFAIRDKLSLTGDLNC